MQPFLEHDNQRSHVSADALGKAAQVGDLAAATAARLDAENSNRGRQQARIDAEALQFLVVTSMIDLVHVGDWMQHVEADNEDKHGDRADQAMQAKAMQRPHAQAGANGERAPDAGEQDQALEGSVFGGEGKGAAKALQQRAGGFVAQPEEKLDGFNAQVGKDAGHVRGSHDRAGDLSDGGVLQAHGHRGQPDNGESGTNAVAGGPLGAQQEDAEKDQLEAERQGVYGFDSGALAAGSDQAADDRAAEKCRDDEKEMQDGAPIGFGKASREGGGVAGHVGSEDAGQSDEADGIDKSADGGEGDGQAGFLAEGVGGCGEHGYQVKGR